MAMPTYSVRVAYSQPAPGKPTELVVPAHSADEARRLAVDFVQKQTGLSPRDFSIAVSEPPAGLPSTDLRRVARPGPKVKAPGNDSGEGRF